MPEMSLTTRLDQLYKNFSSFLSVPELYYNNNSNQWWLLCARHYSKLIIPINSCINHNYSMKWVLLLYPCYKRGNGSTKCTQLRTYINWAYTRQPGTRIRILNASGKLQVYSSKFNFASKQVVELGFNSDGSSFNRKLFSPNYGFFYLPLG